VYKFGGSSVADAQCMRQVAEIICAFPVELPCVVVSAMGKTTNLLLEAGRLAIITGTDSVPSLKPLQAIKALHRDTASLLGVCDETVASVEKLLSELQQLLIGLSIVQVRQYLLHCCAMNACAPGKQPLLVPRAHRLSCSGPAHHSRSFQVAWSWNDRRSPHALHAVGVF
jgi:hypothetical protein